MDTKDKERICRASDLLFQASGAVRILSHISWPASARDRFLVRKARELPEVSYAAFDPARPLALVLEARRHLRSSVVDDWLRRQASAIENSARLLSACGKPDFYRISCELYGTPKAILPDQANTPLAMATQFGATIDSLAGMDLGAPPAACYLAQGVADEIASAVRKMFGAAAPDVQVVDELSANALAGPKRIRLRRSACFTDKDIRQLIQHEAYIHVATSLNGLAQSHLKILGAGHSGTTRTQEGLAVFAEFITGSMDLDRMQRLADRVIAIQMAVEGADFLDVYRYFLERTGGEEQAFENTRRVFRGGVLEGGAPFTKDVVYLDGLLRVHNFLRVIVSTGRADCLRLLFAGKLDLEDIPALVELKRLGLCSEPKYLPPWADDLRFLLCYLSYSSFLNGIDLGQVKLHYESLLGGIPKNGGRLNN
jgi:uncharacterized protein (TIGR02421 family)